MIRRHTLNLLLFLCSFWSLCLAGYADGQIFCNGKSCAADGTVYELSTVQSQLAATPQFVNNGNFLTQDSLRTNFPCGPMPMLGRYARVSDTYQTVASVAICETDGSTYYWRPQRTDYATTSSQTSGTLTLIPFVTAPVVILSSPPTAGFNITPSSLNAWPGAQFRIITPATISLPFSITISGLIGGGTVTALQGRDYTLTYTSNGWKSN